MTTRVLVTGGAGYLGAVLCGRLLAEGHHVHAIDNLMYGEASLLHLCAHERFQFTRGDARDPALMKRAVAGADVLVPLAAVVGAPACERDPQLARSVNLDAIRLLDRLRSPAQLVVYPTTNSGYGTRGGDLHCTEDTPLEPISLYGETKVRAEAELLASAATITLRLATVFGVSARMRIDLLVNHFVYAAVTDGYLVVFEKDFRRNYVHIRDVADCFVHCIDHGDAMVGRPFNVGLDAANYSKEQLAMKIKEHVPNFLVHFAEVGRDPDQRNYVVSNARLRSVGFEARRSVDAGIRELLQGYRMLGRGRFRNC